MKCLVCWRFIQMFKADSELNHYSVLLRNEFFLQTRFYLALPFWRKPQRNTQKVFFNLKKHNSRVPLFPVSHRNRRGMLANWKRVTSSHICQGNNWIESVWHVFASNIILSLMFSDIQPSENKFIFMIKANSPLNLVINNHDV